MRSNGLRGSHRIPPGRARFLERACRSQWDRGLSLRDARAGPEFAATRRSYARKGQSSRRFDMSAGTAVATAEGGAPRTSSTAHQIGVCIGLLATHILLGVVWLLGTAVLVIGKYGLFEPDPPVVDDAAIVVVIAWFVALGVAI